MTAATVTRGAYNFFRKHAGGWVGHSAETAMSLARAEEETERRGWTFAWQEDPEEYEMGDAETVHPKEVLICLLQDADGEVLASLGGIGDPDRAHVRLVQAELASEALHRLARPNRRKRVKARRNAGRKAVGLIGDVNYLDYGGMIIFDDGGVELLQVDENDEKAPVVIYRFDLDKIDGSEWFADELKDVAGTVGAPVRELTERLTSPDLGERASGYYDLVGYFGPHEFDQYPLSLTPREAKKRYAHVDRQLKAMKAHPNPAREYDKDEDEVLSSHRFVSEGEKFWLVEGLHDVTVSVGGDFMGSFEKHTLHRDPSKVGGRRAVDAIATATRWWAAR